VRAFGSCLREGEHLIHKGDHALSPGIKSQAGSLDALFMADLEEIWMPMRISLSRDFLITFGYLPILLFCFYLSFAITPIFFSRKMNFTLKAEFSYILQHLAKAFIVQNCLGARPGIQTEVIIDGYYVPNICYNYLWRNGRPIALGLEQVVRQPLWRKVDKGAIQALKGAKNSSIFSNNNACSLIVFKDLPCLHAIDSTLVSVFDQLFESHICYKSTDKKENPRQSRKSREQKPKPKVEISRHKYCKNDVKYNRELKAPISISLLLFN
jgi:hypothetical protein